MLTVDSVNVNMDGNNACNDTSTTTTTTSQSLKRFISAVKPFKLLFIVGLSLAFLSGVYHTVTCLFIGDAVNDLSSPFPNKVKVHARNYALYFILYTAISFLLEYFRFYSFDYLGECISVDFKRRIFSTFLSLHPGFYDIKSNSPGNLVSKMSMQTEAINGVVLTLFSMVLQGVGNLISGIIISAIYDWRLMLINIAFVPAVVIVNYLLVLYTADENKAKMNKQYGDILSEHLMNISTIHSFNAAAMSKTKFSNAVYCGNENDLKYASITGILNGLTMGVMCFDIAATFYAGGVFIVNDTLTMATFIKAFSSMTNALYFLGMAMKYVKDISSMNEAINGLFAQIETHSEIPPIINDNKVNCDKRSFKGKIEFRNVSFAYPTNQSKRIINNVSFVIRPGEKVAFLGASGAGKSTVTHLIERFYDVSEGEILIDDVNVKNVDLVTMRQCMGYVQQEAALFSRSVFENIQYGDINAGVDDVKEVATKCKVLYKVDTVNEDDKGEMLSGGEKQRVAIARALIRRPKILLMDEATSALDNETANDIQCMLDEIIKEENMTVVVIAHRLQAVKECDRCFYMKNGKIVHVGTFEEIAKFCK